MNELCDSYAWITQPNWAEWVLVWLFMICATSFFVSIALILWRVMNPLPLSQPKYLAPVVNAQGETEADEIERLLKKCRTPSNARHETRA